VVSVPLSAVYTIGALTILGFWFFSSGCWLLVYLPLAKLGRPVASRALPFALIVILLLSSTLRISRGVAESLGESLEKNGRNFDDLLAVPGHA
jgi:hypothetical protein